MELIIITVFLIIVGAGVGIFYNLYKAISAMHNIRKEYWDVIRSMGDK